MRKIRRFPVTLPPVIEPRFLTWTIHKEDLAALRLVATIRYEDRRLGQIVAVGGPEDEAKVRALLERETIRWIGKCVRLHRKGEAMYPPTGVHALSGGRAE